MVFWFSFIDMEPGNDSPLKNDPKISVLEISRLLIELKDERPDICVRVRLIGNNFCRLINVTETQVVLNDESKNKLMFLPINEIMQFEIDRSFQNFQAHNHYDVVI